MFNYERDTYTPHGGGRGREEDEGEEEEDGEEEGIIEWLHIHLAFKCFIYNSEFFMFYD